LHSDFSMPLLDIICKLGWMDGSDVSNFVFYGVNHAVLGDDDWFGECSCFYFKLRQCLKKQNKLTDYPKAHLHYMWRHTSPGNGDLLICINTLFLTQHVLKSWWSWTYQNFTVKRTSEKVVPGWVTSWEVWFGWAKSGQYCFIVVGHYKWYQSHCPA